MARLKDDDRTTAAKVLDLKLDPTENSASAKSVREYLTMLLLAYWAEGEGFDSKRPFGDSDWDGQIYAALVNAGLLEGTVSEGDVDCDWDQAEELMLEVIKLMCS